MSLQQLEKDWNILGELDPFWAVMSWKDKKYGRWDPEEFFALGEEEIEHLWGKLAKWGLCPSGAALDFGCGLGRLTRALRPHFSKVVGVDISEVMVKRARELTPGCEFVCTSNLAGFADAYFDLIYSNVVLQHQPTREIALGFVAEFMRILAPGGIAVFQLPARLTFKRRLQLRAVGFRVMSMLGFSASFAHRLGFEPIRMTTAPTELVMQVVADGKGRVLETTVEDGTSWGCPMNCWYLVQRVRS